jgi:protein-disulfide isomerase
LELRPERPAVVGREGVFSGQQAERDRDLPPAPDAELLPEHVAVRLGGSGGDPEARAHLLVRAARRDQGDDLPLTARDRRGSPLRGQLDHGLDATPSRELRPFVSGCNRGCIRPSPEQLGRAHFRPMARPPKTKKPQAKRRPSGGRVVLAFAIAIGAAVALVVAALVLRDDESSPPPTAAPLVDLNGIPQDGTILGSPDAEVTFIEYADLQCPACRAYAEVVFPTVVDDYVRPGSVKAEYRGLSFIGPDSEKALRFVLAAGLQDRLWNLEEAFFRNQGGENSGWVTDELVRELAGEIPGLDVEQLFEDAESTEVESMMEASAVQAEVDEVTGTPTILLQVGDDEPYKLDPGLGPAETAAALDDALGR